MKNKWIVSLSLVPLFGFLIYLITWSPTRNENDFTSNRPESDRLSERKNTDQNNLSPIISSRKIASDELPNDRSGTQRKRYYIPRHVPFKELPTKLVLEMKRTMLPIMSQGEPFVNIPIESTKDALSHLSDWGISWLVSQDYPHSYSEEPEFLYLWGSHELNPKRGYAVRKSDGWLMVWAIGNDHYWEDAEKKKLSTDSYFRQKYFDAEGDRAEIQEKREEEQRVGEKLYKEYLKRERTRRAAEREAAKKNK